MIPLKDNIPSKTFSYLNILIIATNILVGIYMYTLTSYDYQDFIYRFGFIPARFSLLSLFTSIFVHAGFLHLFSNMLFIWIFGDNVEDKLGHLNFLILYLISGVVSVITHSVFDLNSTIPLVGASGAISGILGAYFVFYPRAKVLTLVILGIFITVVAIPAHIFLGIWFILQLFNGIVGLSLQGSSGGVAWWAHIGGFITGVTIAKLFNLREDI